jgi:hypothetical protein
MITEKDKVTSGAEELDRLLGGGEVARLFWVKIK